MSVMFPVLIQALIDNVIFIAKSHFVGFFKGDDMGIFLIISLLGAAWLIFTA